MAKRMQRIEQVRGRERKVERERERGRKHKRDGQIAGEIWNITAASSATVYCKLSPSSFRILPVQSACFTISSLSVRERAPDQFDFWLVRVLVRLLVLASTYYSSSSSSSTAALAIQALVAVLLLLPLFIPLLSLYSLKIVTVENLRSKCSHIVSRRGQRGEGRGCKNYNTVVIRAADLVAIRLLSGARNQWNCHIIASCESETFAPLLPHFTVSWLRSGLFCESLNAERTMQKRKSIRCFRNAKIEGEQRSDI